jgi:TIR domain-containing protein
MAADLPHDVFISFSSLDSADAALLCERLEKEGIVCWISTRDVKPGENYQAAIVNAIKAAKIVVLAFSANANASPEVSKELSLASAFKVTVIPVRMTEALPQDAFLYELSTRQWIDAFKKWDSALELLVSTAKRICARASEAEDRPAFEKPAAEKGPRASQLPSRATLQIPGAELEEARNVLAYFVGPIAHVLVKRAASVSASLSDFKERLASEVPTAEERKAFLQRIKGLFEKDRGSD